MMCWYGQRNSGASLKAQSSFCAVCRTQANPLYYPQLQEVMTYPQTVGIIGGCPSSSLYFLGFQGQHLIYLDPHHVQVWGLYPAPAARLGSTYLQIHSLSSLLCSLALPSADGLTHYHNLLLLQSAAALPEGSSSYFCDGVQLMPISSMDPSIAMGFYCQHAGEWVTEDCLCLPSGMGAG